MPHSKVSYVLAGGLSGVAAAPYRRAAGKGEQPADG